MSKLWCQEIIEKHFPEEQQVEPEEKVLKTDTELGTVPEWLRPLLWEMGLLEDKLKKIEKATLREKVSGMTLPEFLVKQALAIASVRRVRQRFDLLQSVFWSELERVIPELSVGGNLVIRKGYLVVRSAPKEPEKGEKEERRPGLLIGLPI